ncbi:GTPase domain-containing protein [Myxococcota bacterium]|nr:GTPase domain-containing protein [Myxococcota bacterium]
MPYINYQNREITFKVVYYGPGMSGKTTNLLYIHSALSPDLKGELITLNTDEDRTLFFDFFPLHLGNIDGFNVKFNMYTVPGQVYYEASRKLILDGADGVVFVADSQPFRLEENIESYRLMEDNLRHYGYSTTQFPLVLQYNKRDCVNPLPVGILEEQLGTADIAVFEAQAMNGIGVLETIKELSRTIVMRFQL